MVPTYAPEKLRYKQTTDYVWSNFEQNATTIMECATSHDALPWTECCQDLSDCTTSWGAAECADKTNECLGNGPLGMGTSVLLQNTSSAARKVNSTLLFFLELAPNIYLLTDYKMLYEFENLFMLLDSIFYTKVINITPLV